MADGGDMPPIDESEHEHAEEEFDFQDTWEQYADLEQQKFAASNVIQLRPELVGHTDKELIPVDAKQIIYERMVFDAEESLRNAAMQKWLIDGIIPCDGFGILYGPSGTYKSFLALDIAASVSTGMGWHGFDVDCPGPVLYIAAEGASGLKERAVAWKRYHKRDYGDLVILPMAVMFDDALMTQNFVEASMMVIERTGKPFSMVVIDTMARSFSGDENSAQETGAFINSVSRWRSTLGDCTVLVVAHAGKNVSSGIRGSSALKAACDFVYVISRPAQFQVVVKNEKQKDIDEAENMRFALEPVSLEMKDHKGRERKSLVPILESKGKSADPDDDDQDEFEGPFEAKDTGELVRLIKAAKINNRPITEDDIRKEYISMKSAEGKKPETARKDFYRNFKRAKEQGLIIKRGALIEPKW